MSPIPDIDSLKSQLSFDSIFQQYHKGVYYFFLRKGLSKEEGLEMVQETFLRAYQGLGNTRQDSNLKAWLFTIAINLWRNEVRRRTAYKRVREEQSLDGLRERGVDLPSLDGVDPFLALLETERRRQLHRAVEELPDQMRRCLKLRIVQNLQYEAIATVMQVSVNTVKSQISQARRRLQKRLGSEGGVKSKSTPGQALDRRRPRQPRRLRGPPTPEGERPADEAGPVSEPNVHDR
jgi:RNA polymerase sigma-70 factor (ECF subfamily)